MNEHRCGDARANLPGDDDWRRGRVANGIAGEAFLGLGIPIPLGSEGDFIAEAEGNGGVTIEEMGLDANPMFHAEEGGVFEGEKSMMELAGEGAIGIGGIASDQVQAAFVGFNIAKGTALDLDIEPSPDVALLEFEFQAEFGMIDSRVPVPITVVPLRCASIESPGFHGRGPLKG